MITLQFSGTNTLGSKIVQYGTWSWAGHVDFVLPNGKLLGALPILGGGVRIHEMLPRKSYSRIERYTIDAPDAVLVTALSQLGKLYDWRGIASFVTRSGDWQSPDRWFCSELVMYSFVENGIELIRDITNRVTPASLLLSTKLTYSPIPDDAFGK